MKDPALESVVKKLEDHLTGPMLGSFGPVIGHRSKAELLRDPQQQQPTL